MPGAYTVDRVVMLQVEGCGAQRLYYMILSGPRGGKILLDPLNIGDIVSRKFNMSPYNAQEAIVKYGTKTNKIDLIQASYWQANNNRFKCS